MAKLLLKKNEFTVESLLEFMNNRYKTKTNGNCFSKADIHDWANKQRIPKQYGGEYIRVLKLGPLKILELSQTPFDDYKIRKLEIQIEDE